MKIEVRNVTRNSEAEFYDTIANENLGFQVSYTYQGEDTFRLLLVAFDLTNDCHRENLSRMLLTFVTSGMIVERISDNA